MADPGPAWTDQQIGEALMALVAWAGNAAAAVRHLESEDKRAPSPSTLIAWSRGKHAARYQELREKYADQQESQLAAEYRDVAMLATQVERKGLEKALSRLESGKDQNPSRTAADAATVADKMTGKMLALQGKPTSIREDRNLEEIMRGLVARGVLQVPEPPQLEGAK